MTFASSKVSLTANHANICEVLFTAFSGFLQTQRDERSGWKMWAGTSGSQVPDQCCALDTLNLPITSRQQNFVTGKCWRRMPSQQFFRTTLPTSGLRKKSSESHQLSERLLSGTPEFARRKSLCKFWNSTITAQEMWRTFTRSCKLLKCKSRSTGSCWRAFGRQAGAASKNVSHWKLCFRTWSQKV